MPAFDVPIHPNLLSRVAPVSGLRVREDTAFTDAAGVEKAAIRGRAEQDLELASEILLRLLQPSEAVLYVSRGAFMPATWEQLLENHGATASGALLVLTNARLLVLRTRSKGLRGWVWDQGILVVDWSNVGRAATKGWLGGYLTLKDQAGRQERFFRLSRRDVKKVKLLLGVLVPQSSDLPMSPAAGAPGFTSLCPKCLAALSPGLYRCAQCGQMFKDEKSLLARALLIPGGAYFYSGQKLLGVFSALIELIFILVAVVALLEATGVMPPPAEDTAQMPAFFFIQAAVFLGVLAITKVSSFYRARRRIRRFIPA